MPTNNFKTFTPTDTGTNLLSNSEYAAASDRTNGNQPGVASSKLVNKAIRQSSFITSQFAQFLSNVLTQDVLDVDGGETAILEQMTACLSVLPPSNQSFTSGSGTYYLSYKFFLASGSATAGATYTNNTFTFTVKETIAAGTVLWCTGTGAPAVSGTLTKSGGTGDATITFYAFRKPVSIEVLGVGGGGGGACSGTAGSTAATSGGNTTFGTALLVANGGELGRFAGVGGPTLGGTASIAAGAYGLAINGQGGQGASYNAVTACQPNGGNGGNSHLGGGGAGGCGPGNVVGFAGQAAATNSGSGGGGAGSGSTNATSSGVGGGAGGCFIATINSPAASYAYAVGAAGTGGAAGTNGTAGGNGAAGVISVKENWQ